VEEDSTIEEEEDGNILSVDMKVAILVEKNKAMIRALRGEWSSSFYFYVSIGCRKFIDAIRKSKLPEAAQDIVINMTITMHPFSSNIF